MVLFVDACPRKESRTRKIADALLSHKGAFEVVDLKNANLVPLDEKRLEHRMELLQEGKYQDSMFDYARQFADAEEIVIAAPLWDLSFPAILKIYLENIYVVGVVTKYGEKGKPVGLCKAKKLYFVTTAGGPMEVRFGYEYIKALATECFGIKEVVLVQADMLDVVGFDAEVRVNEIKGRISNDMF